MSDDREKNGGKEGEEFLSRWSRLKEQSRKPPETETRPATPAGDPQAPPPALPPLDVLTYDSDLRGFFHPKVDEVLKRSALKKLFADPYFNVMDGLDVYIDDYSKPDPLPAAMLAQLRQAKKIIEWAKERKGEDAAKTAELSDATPTLPPTGHAELQTPAAVQPPAGEIADAEQHIGSQTADPRKA
jgi:hypothetical protein